MNPVLLLSSLSFSDTFYLSGYRRNDYKKYTESLGKVLLMDWAENISTPICIYMCVCGCLLRKHVWPSLTYPVYQLSSPPQHCIQLLWEWQWLIEPAIDLHFLSQVWHIKLSPGGENWIRSIIIFVCLIRLNLCLHILEQVGHSKHALTIYIYILLRYRDKLKSNLSAANINHATFENTASNITKFRQTRERIKISAAVPAIHSNNPHSCTICGLLCKSLAGLKCHLRLTHVVK